MKEKFKTTVELNKEDYLYYNTLRLALKMNGIKITHLSLYEIFLSILKEKLPNPTTLPDEFSHAKNLNELKEKIKKY